MITKTKLVILFVCFFSLKSFAQLGCTDPQATNFNTSATYNDGSCNYGTTNYALTQESNLPNELNEISGMIFWNGKIYGHQDSGGPTSIYEIEPSTGTITKTINLVGITNVDWEDITQDDTHFYISDTGNNSNGNRTDLKVYKFAKSLVTADLVITISNLDIEIINFSYEDQTDFSPTGSNNTSFDCEAIAYNRGKLHLFTKNWIGPTTSHYVIPISEGTHIAKKKESYDTGTIKITGADFGAYDLLILIGYETVGLGNCAIFLDYGFDGTYFYFNSGAVRKLDIGSAITLGQLEGICFENALKGYTTNEFLATPFPFADVNQKMYSFNITNLIQDYYENNQVIYNPDTQPYSAGTIRFNNITSKVEGYDGTHWNPFH